MIPVEGERILAPKLKMDKSRESLDRQFFTVAHLRKINRAGDRHRVTVGPNDGRVGGSVIGRIVEIGTIILGVVDGERVVDSLVSRESVGV